jgi:hypothetical protein
VPVIVPFFSLPLLIPPPTTTAVSPPVSIIVYTATGQPGSVALGIGCNSVVVATLPGTPLTLLAARVLPGGSVASIWRFSNSLHAYQAGYFGNGGPTDFMATGGGQEAYLICVSRPATISSG